MEILVVLALIGLLAGLAIAHLNQAGNHANEQVASIFVSTTIKTPLMLYKLQRYRYPTTNEGLGALVSPPADGKDTWGGPYLDPAVVPTDPWGEPYQYASPGKNNPDSYDIWSKGPDRQSGTPDDVGNWPRKKET